MSWRLLFSVVFATAYLVWIWRGHEAYSRIGSLLCLVGSLGICIDLANDYVKTLPSHAPLRTITGLATNESSDLLSSHSHFVLIEVRTGRRMLFTTAIKGPWADEPVRATYADDGRTMPSVVRIEILNSEQFPWHVEQGHAGWIGNAEAKRRLPLAVTFLGFVLIVAGAFAPANKRTIPEEPEDGNSRAPGVLPANRT